MNILIICPMLPWPVKSGGDQAVFNMINYLQFKCKIHFLYPSTTIKINNELKDKWKDVIFHPYIKRRTFGFIKSRYALRIYNRFKLGDSNCDWLQSASNFFTPDFLEYVNKVIKDINPDIVQTEFYNYQDLVFVLPKEIKKIFIQHEIHYVINSQRLCSDFSPAKLYAFNKLKGEEILAMNSYDAVFTLTDNDKEELIRNGVTSKIYSSPAGIQEPEKRNPCIFDNKIIFVGGSGHSPNLEGIVWFLENVWETIQIKHPEVVLNIIGNWDDAISKKIINKFSNIKFKGFVPNLQEEYKGSIAIVPILRGSGMRMKILDAVNFGSPFVTTTIGVDGLKYKDSIDCFITDDNGLFAKRIIDLIENQSIREKFYYNSIITRDKFYSMKALADKRFYLYNKIVNIV